MCSYGRAITSFEHAIRNMITRSHDQSDDDMTIAKNARVGWGVHVVQ